jgi:hypothetical protein
MLRSRPSNLAFQFVESIKVPSKPIILLFVSSAPLLYAHPLVGWFAVMWTTSSQMGGVSLIGYYRQSLGIRESCNSWLGGIQAFPIKSHPSLTDMALGKAQSAEASPEKAEDVSATGRAQSFEAEGS